ncbi:MAG: hypothetical protein ACFFAN_03895 [Promethearchaeota archaeon]
MIDQMEEALDYGKKLIDKELDAGIFNFIIKPIVKTFYNYWSEGSARSGTLQQIKITLDCAEFVLNNGMEEENFNKVIEENFPIYLEGDQTYRQCQKDHRNFNILKEITKKSFVSQVQEAILFLNVEQEARNYDDLVIVVFKTKEKAYESLKRQLEYNDEGIKIVESDPSILKIPTGKNIILKVLRKGFEKTKSELIKRLENIFE